MERSRRVRAKELEKVRMRGGVKGAVGGSRGSRGVWGGPEVLGGKTAKNTKTPEKTLRMASLLRSNIQNFVQ